MNVVSSPLDPYDGILLVSFGGPEGPADVLPFMENVTRGRGIPKERLLEVSAHYQRFGGVSPINGQNRALLVAMREVFSRHGVSVPIAWGNRNWDPTIPAALRELREAGCQRVLALVTSAFSSASGCRQYREDVAQALEKLAAEPGGAPTVDKIRVFYNHAGFVEPMIDNTIAAVAELVVGDITTDHVDGVELAFTAHSIPMAMADTSDYVAQLREACRLIAEGASRRIGRSLPWDLVFQSRSGAPGQPWLEPDISEHLRARQSAGVWRVAVVPVGFISDHMEVVWDLDTQARETANEIGLAMSRAATVGVDSRFVDMIFDLAVERAATVRGEDPIRAALGIRGPNHDVCPVDCCPLPARPVGASLGSAGRPVGGGRP